MGGTLSPSQNPLRAPLMHLAILATTYPTLPIATWTATS